MASGRVNKNSKYCQYRMLDKNKYFGVVKCKRKADSRLAANDVPYCNEHLQEMNWVLSREADL